MRLLPLRRAALSSTRVALTALLAFTFGAGAGRLPAAPAAEPLVSLARTVPAAHLGLRARDIGRLAAGTTVSLALSLPLRNVPEMQTLMARLYDPSDALYRRWLTQPQFAARFGPTPEDYNAVLAFARAQGLTIVHTYPSRSLVDVSGTRDAVEAAFHTRLNGYVTTDGRRAYANTIAPSVPLSMASRIASIVGLNTVTLFKHPHYHVLSQPAALRPLVGARPEAAPRIGTGPAGGLAPADIKTAYSLTSVAPADLTKLTGAGQTLGLYELDGYALTDIQAYTAQFNLPAPNLKNILYGGFNGVAGANTLEVVLDIDMMLALAPNATIYVYEAQNGSAFQISMYQKIADDNLAKSVSSSFGLPEADAQLNGEIGPETQAFQQMALQGQSNFAAAGDAGAYDDNLTLSVDSPASNPNMTGVGGTTLSINPQSGAYAGEVAWSDATDTRFGPFGVGGGGGISAIHTIPTYQAGIAGASATARNVPDVSLDADFNTGYDISQGGMFLTVGGTSAASPLWAAFTGLVNEERSKFGVSSTVGFLNPTLYNIYRTGNYTGVFHDISDGSTNLYYATKKGYDNATGLGTFIGDQLLAELSPATSSPVTVTGTVTDLSTGQPATGATVTITCLQIPGYALTPTVTNGAFTVTLDSMLTTDTTTGKKVPLVYSVSADETSRSGDTKNVTPSLTNTVTLNIGNPDHTFTSGTLQMISAPYDYTSVGDFATLFDLTPPLTGTGVNFIVYSPAVSRYLYYPSAPADTFHPGQGYWAAFPANAYIRRRGQAAPTGPFRVQLTPGWNQIGDPFTTAVTISTIQVTGTGTATATTTTSTPIAQSTLVSFPIYGYTPPTATSANGYYQLDSSGLLQPWQGYWIYANQPAVLVFPGQ